jgi:formyltetrahydrofolate-dependent phosphoribosylglycinamide formyltransferase
MSSRIAVLVSGRGSNLQALHAYLERAGGAEVALVVSDRASSGALTWARERGIATTVLDAGPDEAAALLDVLRAHRVEFVVLAGYLRLVPPEVVRAYRHRMVNVHPALLPAFGGPGMYGHRVHRAVLDSGARVSGPTVHFVDEIYDHGQVIAQWPVPVMSGDDEASLAARVLRVEHLLLPRVVHRLAAGRQNANQGEGSGPPWGVGSDRLAFLFGAPDDDALAESMSAAVGGVRR